jgi:chromosome segregation ATPase
MPAVAEYVRLEPADLAAMATRANQFLTPDGAQAWYGNDIPKLLQELALMRAEHHEARDCFGDASDDPLPVVAQRWQETATGLWEKAQVKKLRDEIKLLKAELADAVGALQDAQADVQAKAETNAKLTMDLGDLGNQINAIHQQAHALGAQEAAQRAELQERLDGAEREIKRLAGLAERNTQIVTAQAQEEKARIREAAIQLLELCR